MAWIAGWVHFQRTQAEPLWQLRVAVGVAMKSTTYCGEAFVLSVPVHLYSISGDGLRESLLGQVEVFWGAGRSDVRIGRTIALVNAVAFLRNRFPGTEFSVAYGVPTGTCREGNPTNGMILRGGAVSRSRIGPRGRVAMRKSAKQRGDRVYATAVSSLRCRLAAFSNWSIACSFSRSMCGGMCSRRMRSFPVLQRVAMS